MGDAFDRTSGNGQNCDLIMTTSKAREANPRRGWRLLWDFLRNAAVLLALWFMYAAVRRFTADDWTAAVANAGRVLDFQDALGLPSESRVQSFVVGSPLLVKLFNAFYMWGHFPLTGAFMTWVFFFRRDSYPVIRESLVFLTLAGLVIHLIFPLAPPRILPNFVDTGAVFGPSPYDLSASSSANVIAAMPSLHVGWALIVAISIISLTRSRWRYLALVHPVLTTAVVVVTANHYWIDAFVAILLVIGAWEFSARLAHQQLPSSGSDADEDEDDVIQLDADELSWSSSS